MSPENARQRADDIAAQIALQSLVKVVIARLLQRPDETEFRREIAGFDQVVIAEISAFRLGGSADETTKTAIIEAACGFASRLLASIVHGPAD